MKLEGNGVVIRDLTAEDAAALCRIAHEAPIEKFVPQLSDGLNAPEDYLPLIEKQDGSLYAIARKDNDELIGTIGRAAPSGSERKGIDLLYLRMRARAWVLPRKLSRSLPIGHCAMPIRLILCWPWMKTMLPLPAWPEKCGFTLSERRVTVSHRLLGMTGDTYLYFRKY